MALDRRTLDSTGSPTRNRSLLSKFTDRFGGGNRSISDFHIEPDDPWKTYSPGDVVNGSVILTVTKPTRITHLVVCLHGYVKVFKNPVAPGESAQDSGYLGPGRGRRGGEYLGNGFASLFEDEVVLCGDGRLKEGVYKFRFELCFPPCSLPSSIHFERGTISYLITSTLTRPTTMSPTLSCDKRIILLESVDIAPLAAPKPKVISLEPISRESKSRSKRKSTSGDPVGSGGVGTLGLSSNGSDTRPPHSPVPSDDSSSSCVTGSTQSFQVVSDPGSSRHATLRNGERQSLSTLRPDGTITATTKILRSGALPGEVVPLHVSVQHTKPIRSPHGIIITLYRQGRIDMYPAIPIGVPEKGKKPVYEDYYPKSRTGLGGLSFGATRSNCLYRKDLSQSFSPLIIDPNSMKAEVKTSVRIPEDSFPTITRVPGAMISFRYYVEVVMDLGGKVAAQDRFLPRLSMVNPTGKYRANARIVSTTDRGRGMVATDFAGNVVDTDQLRREKNVVACIFEVVIGTDDSSKGGRQRDGTPSSEDPQHDQQTTNGNGDTEQSQRQPPQQHQLQFTEYDLQTPDEYYEDDGYRWQDHHYHPFPHEALPSQFVPPAQPDEVVDEKTRLKRAEEMLLPSEPPPTDHVASSSTAPPPSAPALSENDLPHQYHHSVYNSHDPAHSVSFNGFPIASAPSFDTLTGDTRNLEPSSSFSHPAPSYSDSYNGPDEQPVPYHQHDKQELERHRLLNEASAPSDDPSPENPNHHRHPPNGVQNEHAPSAPALTEEDIIGQPSVDGESLPRYQR